MSIVIENLSFQYGKQRALRDITIRVEPGNITGLLGHNGAGKSTLFRILCGLLTHFSGQVTVDGFELPQQREKAQAAIGYVAQRFSLYEDLSVKENLSFYVQAYGLKKHLAAERVEQMLERFELGSRQRQRTGTLSQGWKQRLAFAAALAHRPKVLLLDEVTAGLDSGARAYAWEVIRGEADRGATILFSTHQAEEAAQCDAKVWLEEGSVVANSRGGANQ